MESPITVAGLAANIPATVLDLLGGLEGVMANNEKKAKAKK